jgi:hypothetical protein
MAGGAEQGGLADLDGVLAEVDGFIGLLDEHKKLWKIPRPRPGTV